MKFMDIEVAVRMIYYAGEAVPVSAFVWLLLGGAWLFYVLFPN